MNVRDMASFALYAIGHSNRFTWEEATVLIATAAVIEFLVLKI